VDRRRFLVTSLLGAVAAPLGAGAQQAGRAWRIGHVLASSPERVGFLAQTLESRLRERGYVHDRNIKLVHRFAPPTPGGIADVLREIIPNIDLLIVWSTIGAIAAKKLTTDLPTIFLTVGDPIRIGLVPNLARPGGNMTGVTFEAASETYGKRLQILKEIAPNLSTVAVLGATGDANVDVALNSLQQVAPTLHVTLKRFDFQGETELHRVFTQMESGGTQAIVVVAGALTYTLGAGISDLALTYRFPSVHAFRESVAAGGLISLGPDLVVMAAQAAAYVDKIIRGAKPGDLPVEQPARYEMHLNLKTAKALGLTIPRSLLLRADQVIE
jgi:putative ABC transport system substrate-binding protein